MLKTYTPFAYTAHVKRAGSAYLVRGILLGDVAAIVFAYIWFLDRPLIGAMAIVCLHFGLWAVYELGYHENDRMAAEREVNGTVPEHFSRVSGISATGAWATFAVLSLLGCGLLYLASDAPADQDAAPAIFGDFAIWTAFNVVGRAVFSLYNHIGVASRLALYPFLQLVRLGGYGLLMSTTLAGTILLAAFVLGRWIPYVVYRATSVRWADYNKLIILVTFLALLPLGMASAPAAVFSLQTLAIVVWLGLWARREIARFAGEASWLMERPAAPGAPPER